MNENVLRLLLAFLSAGFEPAAPSTGRLAVYVQAEIKYSWWFKDGEMLVELIGVPSGMFAVEARRKVLGREIVVGRSAEVCRCSAGAESVIEVSVWPTQGRVLKAGDYPAVVVGWSPGQER